MAEEKARGLGPGLVVGGIGGATLASIVALLLAAKPAEAAPPDEKVNYLIEALTTLIPVLAEVAEGQTQLAEGQTQLVEAIQQWLAAQGIAPPGVEVTVSAPWVAKDPEQIFSQAIRTAEISIADTRELAVDVGDLLTCLAGGNISAGPAWDDWHPHIGVRIITAMAPTAGILTITATIQE